MRDPHFFLNTFAPQTTHMAFIDMSIEDFVEPYFAWRVELNEMTEHPWEVKKQFTEGSLTDKLGALLPLVQGYSNKTMVLETKANWVVFLSNGFRGGDVSNPTSHMVKKLKGRMITVCYSEDDPINKVGGLSFTYHDWRQDEPIIRNLHTHRDGRWQFLTYGVPLPFEETQNYTAKKIKDRLTIDMVERYLRHFGIEWFDPDFYEGKAYLIRGYPLPNATYFDEFPNQKKQSE